MTKSNIVEEAKAEVAASKLKTKSTPWYVNALVWVMDVLAAIAVLTLAIVGGISLIQTSLNGTVKIGIAALVVGLLASRLLERVFQARR